MSKKIVPEFEKWTLGFSGCDGGDIGSPESRAIWLCGIEWGGGHDAQSLSKNMNSECSFPPLGYDNWKENLAYIFNRQAMKLFSAISKNEVSEYKKYAEFVRPFVIGSQGFFKMNLYPIAFKNTSFGHWKSEFSSVTGLAGKYEYLQWCEINRFPAMRQWVSQYQPKLIICLGGSYKAEFLKAFFDHSTELQSEIIEDKEISWGMNRNGTLVVVIPFMVNRHGLTRNVTIQKFGIRIAELLELNGC